MKCEVCNKPIPKDYGNKLCDEHYKALEEENALKQAQENEEKAETGQTAFEGGKRPTDPIEALTEASVNGIADPSYQENPEAEDKEQWLTNIKQFQQSGKLLWPPQRQMYTFVKDWMIQRVGEHPQYPKYLWKPKVVDVGCGVGGGSNILSQEADFVWGVDKNENSVKFAQEAFTRGQNQLYYTPQVTFDRIDIMEDSREFLRFDVVVAIEVIEHIGNPGKFLEILIKKFAKEKNGSYDVESGATEFFISTPNRNNKNLSKEKPKNAFHCREWTSQEAHAFFSRYFTKVESMNSAGEPVPENTDHTPILIRASLPK